MSLSVQLYTRSRVRSSSAPVYSDTKTPFQAFQALLCCSRVRNRPMGPVGRVPSNFGDHGDRVYSGMSMQYMVPSNFCDWLWFFFAGERMKRVPNVVTGFKRGGGEKGLRNGTGETGVHRHRQTAKRAMEAGPRQVFSHGCAYMAVVITLCTRTDRVTLAIKSA